MRTFKAIRREYTEKGENEYFRKGNVCSVLGPPAPGKPLVVTLQSWDLTEQESDPVQLLDLHFPKISPGPPGTPVELTK